MRWVSLLLVVVVVAAGCSQGRNATSRGGASELEVAVFKGGYGIDFFETAAREYEAAHPGVRIKVWGSPRVWEQLRPRFVAGSPPDLCYPGWGLDHWSLVYDKQVIPLDEYLDGPAEGGHGTWRGAFEPALLRLGQHEGRSYMLPHFYSINGWWFNRYLFEKHGWKAPRTWSELIELCERIKAAGIAPITFQGKYPAYAVGGFLLPWAASAGGQKAVDDAQSLVPGAWKSPAMLDAARRIKELRDRGFLQAGANGMSHTEAQMEFVQGRAAMIPCGTWLHSEMRNQLPPTGFELRFFLPPVIDGGKGDATAVSIGIEPWMVPAKGKQREHAIGYFRYLTSLPKAKEFVEQKGTLMSIEGSDQAKLPPHLVGAADAFRRAQTVWSVEYVQWYPKLGTATQNAMAALMNGTITPEVFCQRCEDAAEQARNDATLPKRRVARD